MKSTSDVMLRAKDLQEAKNYYNGVLGFPITSESERVIGFDTGSFILYFEPGEENGSVFEFEVDDLEEAKRNLIEQGCALVEEDPDLPRCYLRDPFGLIFNLTKSYGGR
ncbi:MAG TPA: VOC family protein [Candidatus Rubrimentiphilum sp.]|nr:VOC family protein [Candidatus Rubrimentiphilum sp.]